MANIFLVEDREPLHCWVKDLLEQRGHKVVAVEETLDGALARVDGLESLKVEVVVLDGNLTKGDNSGEDGRRIAAAIRERYPNVRILAWSNEKYDWGDSLVRKGRGLKKEDFNPLLEAVDEFGVE